MIRFFLKIRWFFDKIDNVITKRKFLLATFSGGYVSGLWNDTKLVLVGTP
jgi:hypothetical protein